jgi:hypothetical protein
MRIRFEEVKIKGVRRWIENGKKRQETRTFMQTLNPFNTDADGCPKSRCQILKELYAERDEWVRRNGPKCNLARPWEEPA